MKKRIASLFLAVIMLIPLATSVFPIHVHATGLYCEGCGEWKDDSVNWCSNCYLCEDCVDGWCPDCANCYLCGYELGLHCPECFESCVDPSYGNVPHCVSCMKCENCADLTDTSNGPLCEDCLEDFQENGANKMCANCGVNVLYNEDLDEETEACADCGEHCVDCYEEFLCPECSECTLCKGVELCESCGICEECAESCGYHCPECGDCYADVGQCPDEGEHCVNCCEFVCDNCGTCADGAGIDFCEECGKCENCWEHCEVCEECFEENGECEEHGDHCAECCVREGWICDGCGRCTEALGLEFCEYCDLCEECCRENSKYYGVKKCILDKETKPETLDPSKHDENHHILRYNSSSEECHDVWCIFPGCDYYLSDCTPHEFSWKTVEKATITKEGKRTGICVYCGVEREETIPKLDPPEYYFVEQPKDISVLPTKNNINFYIKLGEVGSEAPPHWGHYLYVSAFPVIDGDPLPSTVKELRKNIFQEDVRDPFYHLMGMDYVAGSGIFPCTLFAKSNSFEGKFVHYTAQGKTLTWRLAVYDVRGGKITYSDPFTIDWNAKHTKHTVVWVSGQISDAEYNLYFKNSITAQTLKFFDGTYHWEECSVCGERITVPMRHRYVLKNKEGNCKGGVEHYECKDCGHTFDIAVGYAVTGHTFSSDYKHNDKNHWQICTVCGGAGPATAHDLKQKVFKDCTKTIVTTVCETCGYAHIEHSSGAGHKYTSDGDYDGWYGDSTHHWKICTVCGYVNKAEHSYKNGVCTGCGYDLPQLAIVGVPCTHGTELTIQLISDIDPTDKALFEAGKWNATWFDADSGNTVGLGKTYPVDIGDEGHMFWAEVQIIGGYYYNAYMYSPIHTVYQDVKGYPATCVSEGLKDHKVCLGCGGKFINGEPAVNVVIPKLTTHTYDYACDAVCNVCGYVRDVAHHWSDKYIYAMDGHRRQCTVCGAISGLEPHNLVLTWQTEADCEHDGVCEQKCECGYAETDYVKASGHSWIHADAVPALCVNEGFAEHYYCENCYAMATDAEGKDRVGIKKLLTPFDPENHIGSNKFGFNKDEHYTVCECGAHIENAAHTFGEDGRCTVCGYKKGSTVKTSVDGLTKHDMVLPNCVTTGTKAYYTDKDGKMYLSRAGIKEVTADDLILPVSTVRHVGGDSAHSYSEHWIACACGAELKHGVHTFDDKGVCTVCGFAKNGLWWILIVVAAAICIVILVIILFVKKKKNDAPPPATPAPGGPAGSDNLSDARENEEDTDDPKKE